MFEINLSKTTSSTALTRLSPLDLGLTQAVYSVNGTCDFLGISRPTFYRMVGRGELSVTKVGHRITVAACDIAELLNRNRRPATTNAIAA